MGSGVRPAADASDVDVDVHHAPADHHDGEDQTDPPHEHSPRWLRSRHAEATGQATRPLQTAADKHRFGATDELGVFEMSEQGMAPLFVGLGTSLDAVTDLIGREEGREFRPR